MSKVMHEGWLARYGKRKIGRSFYHMRYFVLYPTVLAYYKRKPKDNAVPLKTLPIDGNCRVEDRGFKTHHGHMIYDLWVYNMKDKQLQITMGASDSEEAHTWKRKIELAIDQQQDSMTSKNRRAFASLDFDMDFGAEFSLSDRESAHESGPSDEDENGPSLARRTTIGNGPPELLHDWTKESELGFSNQNDTSQFYARKNWRLVNCQNGLRIFEELVEVDYLPRSCSKAMKAVGVVEASCEAIFGLVMSMDATRFEWDCSFHYGSLVEEVDGHTATLYHRLQLNWLPVCIWPRDLCYMRYWRRNDDGSYVVLFRSVEHPNCGPQPGFVRAFIESGGYQISPLKARNGRPRSQVQNLMQIDLKGWVVNYCPAFQQHSLLQMLNGVAGLREYFSQTDDLLKVPRIPVMHSLRTDSVSSEERKPQDGNVDNKPVNLSHSESRSTAIIDEESDDDEYGVPEANIEEELEQDLKSTEEEPPVDISIFTGVVRRDEDDNSRNCWRVPEAKNFKVRSKNFPQDKSKIPGGKYLMELAAVDWFKDNKRMDHVARRQGCAAQVAAEKGLFSLVANIQIPGPTQYSMVFYFVTRSIEKDPLLQRLVDGDDEFRNSRLKLIPSVYKGSWIVRQSVGSTPCLLGKAVDCAYYRGPGYLEVDVDIGSSAVARGVLGLVLGVVTTLVVDMAFLVQANTVDELPEQLIGAVRVAHIETSSAVDLNQDGSSAAG